MRWFWLSWSFLTWIAAMLCSGGTLLPYWLKGTIEQENVVPPPRPQPPVHTDNSESDSAVWRTPRTRTIPYLMLNDNMEKFAETLPIWLHSHSEIDLIKLAAAASSAPHSEAESTNVLPAGISVSQPNQVIYSDLGIFRRCVYPQHIPKWPRQRPSSRDAPPVSGSSADRRDTEHSNFIGIVKQCGHYPFRKIPHHTWQICMVLLCIGCGILFYITFVLFMLGFCLHVLRITVVYKSIQFAQFFAGVLVLIACLLFPFGWKENAEVTQICGDTSNLSIYNLGERCHIGWAFVLTCAGGLLALLSTSLPLLIFYNKNGGESGVISACCAGNELDRSSETSSPSLNVNDETAETEESSENSKKMRRTRTHDSFELFSFLNCCYGDGSSEIESHHHQHPQQHEMRILSANGSCHGNAATLDNGTVLTALQNASINHHNYHQNPLHHHASHSILASPHAFGGSNGNGGSITGTRYSYISYQSLLGNVPNLGTPTAHPTFQSSSSACNAMLAMRCDSRTAAAVQENDATGDTTTTITNGGGASQTGHGQLEAPAGSTTSGANDVDPTTNESSLTDAASRTGDASDKRMQKPFAEVRVNQNAAIC